jgi:hypothetical protein
LQVVAPSGSNDNHYQLLKTSRVFVTGTMAATAIDTATKTSSETATATSSETATATAT